MKNKQKENKIIKNIIEWFGLFIKLINEILLFLLNIPLYLSLFFYGLRASIDEYLKIARAVESKEKSIDYLFKARMNEIETTKLFAKLHNQKIRLIDRRDKLYYSLFPSLIAVLALFISLISLVIKKQ